MRETSVGNKIVIAERDNIAAVMENGKVSEFFVHRGEIILGDVFLAQVENILPSIIVSQILEIPIKMVKKYFLKDITNIEYRIQ